MSTETNEVHKIAREAVVKPLCSNVRRNLYITEKAIDVEAAKRTLGPRRPKITGGEWFRFLHPNEPEEPDCAD
jgi:hypothetical protein